MQVFNKTKKELCGIWGYIRETTYSGESNDRRKEIIISIYEINEDNTFGRYGYFIHHNGTTEESIQKGEYKISKDYFHGKLYSYVVNFSNGDTTEYKVDSSKYSESFKIDAHALLTPPFSLWKTLMRESLSAYSSQIFPELSGLPSSTRMSSQS